MIDNFNTPNKNNNCKDKNLFAFLNAVKKLSAISQCNLLRLANRFSIEPDSLSILISLYGGGHKNG